MSGDVQPRKRKDKKKRKDEDSYSPLNEDVNIHVHKEGGTGGNICAKIVFFFLFSALIVLIGLIIKENQGLTELEDVEPDSRYSQIFEGWVDKNIDEHEDDHSPELSHEQDDHDFEEEENDDHDESEEDHVEETEEEQSEEVDHDEEEEEDDDESITRSEEETNEETEEEDQIPESEEDSTIEEDFSEEVQEQSESQEKNKDETDEVDDNVSEADQGDDDDDTKEVDKSKEQSKEEEVSEEVKAAYKSDEVKAIHKSDEDEKESESKKDVSKEAQNDIKLDSKEVQGEEEILDEPLAEEKQEVDEPVKPSSGNVNVGEELESDSDKDEDDYEHASITNKEDYKVKDDIDAAQEQLNKNAAYANQLFEAILDKNPFSPRTLFGKAKALDIMAEEKQSNELLEQALSYYMRTLNAPNVPDPLFVIVAERYIDRARFIGQYKKAIGAHWQLIERFPVNSTYLNNLAVTYLTINLVEEARSVLERVLSKWPNDGFALVHYGFILKTTDNNLEESVHYMVKGLKTKDPGVIDGRFYFHLGDALNRLNRNEQAMNLYEEGVQEKVFLSKYQRSLYNEPRLTAKPWWEPADLPSYEKLFLALKDNWHKIRTEGLSTLNEQGYFRDEAENLKDTGTWKQLELFARGQKFAKNCAKTPVTCSVIQSFPDARSCRRGQTKFSVMHPGTHVWPHCGPTNCRLRIHLGLKVPPNTFIRVAEETRSWKEGDIIIFDDSFEHEVWHNGSDFRLVLIVDVWHPELTPSEKKNLSSI